MDFATLLATVAALGFGIALVFTKLGLRHVSARAGAAISIPSATLLFWCAAPFAFDPTGWKLEAIGIFALVGVFFPALVTLLVFEANDRMGPTVAGTISSTTPLFAAAGAIFILGEAITPMIAAGAVTVVAGVAAIAWRPGGASKQWSRAAIGLPILAAAIRGLSQAIIKLGLALWPNPFAAALTGYSISSAAVVAVNRFAEARAPFTSKRQGVGWFVLAGLSNGGAVLAMYHALERGSVAVVSTIVAAHPFVALLVGVALFRFERIDAPRLLGVLLAVGGVVLVILGNARS